jgi:LPXTG-motif cell wall-anchored protein
MRTRFAIGLILAVSLMAVGPVTAGAQISDAGQAAQVQYPDIPPPEDPPEPAEEAGLPVTGFVAIPLLITGAVLLLTGGVLHVRTRRRD